MSKLLVFLLVLFVIYWVRRVLSKPKIPPGSGSRPGAQRGGETQASTRMLSCQRCGVHVPESEGVRYGGEFFCCEAHARGRDDS
ncbi:PP0621 family protein [Zoogloeaceae bacterium G21618-S1]|nr:PP0621 family protein [Zoogloeaceae bacterium G21618-S1]